MSDEKISHVIVGARQMPLFSQRSHEITNNERINIIRQASVKAAVIDLHSHANLNINSTSHTKWIHRVYWADGVFVNAENEWQPFLCPIQFQKSENSFCSPT